jgi:hypothetical protein
MDRRQHLRRRPKQNNSIRNVSKLEPHKHIKAQI